MGKRLFEAPSDRAVADLNRLGREVRIVHKQINDVAAQKIAVQTDILRRRDELRRADARLALVTVKHSTECLNRRVLQQTAAHQKFMAIGII